MKFELTSYITKSGRVISTGHNKQVEYIHNVQRGSRELWNINTCAEKDAIQKALKLNDGSRHLIGSTIYVQRFNKNGETRMAKPCKHCQELIEAVGVKKVIYTTSDGVVNMLVN